MWMVLIEIRGSLHVQEMIVESLCVLVKEFKKKKCFKTLDHASGWKVNEGADISMSMSSPSILQPLSSARFPTCSLLPGTISTSPPTQSPAIWAIPVGLVPQPTATDLAFYPAA